MEVSCGDAPPARRRPYATEAEVRNENAIKPCSDSHQPCPANRAAREARHEHRVEGSARVGGGCAGSDRGRTRHHEDRPATHARCPDAPHALRAQPAVGRHRHSGIRSRGSGVADHHSRQGPGEADATTFAAEWCEQPTARESAASINAQDATFAQCPDACGDVTRGWRSDRTTREPSQRSLSLRTGRALFCLRRLEADYETQAKCTGPTASRAVPATPRE